MLLSADKLIEAGSILQEGIQEFLLIFHTRGIRKRGIVVAWVADKGMCKGQEELCHYMALR